MTHQFQLFAFQPGEMGGDEDHGTRERAQGPHLLPSQIPVKIDGQEQLMALLGMLQPSLPSVKFLMPFPKTIIFLNFPKHCLWKNIEYPRHTSGLLLSRYNII